MDLYKLGLSIKVLGGAFVLASALLAAPVTVVNHSFETLPTAGLPESCGIGCLYSEDNIPGWVTVASATTGQFQPGTHLGNFNYFDTLPDQITVAYSNGGTISQTVAPTVQLGMVYLLLVDVGVRKDIGNPGTVQLLIGGNAPIFATGVAAAPGSWSTYAASYTGLADDVGKSITIALSAPGAQGDWDNVRLDASLSAVPEPAAASLIGIGLLGLGFLARKRRA